jgi:DNA-directed RNA polymerase specialized sigma24 family protein
MAASLLSSLEESIPALRRYAMTLLGDRHDADDVVRECVVTALDQLSARYHQPWTHVWLLGLVHRKSVGRLRRKGIHWEPSALNTSGAAAQRAPSEPDADIGPDAMVRVFGNLPVELRSVLFLVSVEELAYSAVADVLGVSIAVVMSLLAAGREQLRVLSEASTPCSARRLA